MNGLLLLNIALTALAGSLCTILYTRLNASEARALSQREQLDRIEVSLHGLMEVHERMQKRVDQLATDVLQREIYQGADYRHQLAIEDARAGCTVMALVQKHGLSSDEAALIVALHGAREVSWAGSD